MSEDKALTDAAQARKRRKIHLSSKKKRDDASDSEDSLSLQHDDEEEHAQLPSIRGIKHQARYDPGVPMNREQLKAWRKEARRVRNRESAAASRRRTRDRIDELEGQVQVLESRYAKALQRIVELEATAVPRTIRTTPPQGSQGALCSPKEVSPAASPRTSFVLHSEEDLSLPLLLSSSSPSFSSYQHVMDHRPNA